MSPWPGERLALPAGDGTGDRFLAMLHRPHPVSGDEQGPPLVVLVHGLTGCEGSFYVLETTRFLLVAGYPALRLNLRGAGPSRQTCTGHYCAGSSGDLAAALAALDGALTANGLVLVGYSLGGNIVLKLIAEAPVRPLCAMAVSTPIDLSATARRMMSPRNMLYHRWLLARMKHEALDGAAAVTAAERRAILGARTVREYDDAFIAPRNGYAGADDYYRRCSAAAFLDRIETPTLLIHARDDPWIPADAYEGAAWPEMPLLRLLLSGRGGHVGFHGRDRETPWHNACLRAFIEGMRTGNDRAGRA